MGNALLRKKRDVKSIGKNQPQERRFGLKIQLLVNGTTPLNVLQLLNTELSRKNILNAPRYHINTAIVSRIPTVVMSHNKNATMSHTKTTKTTRQVAKQVPIRVCGNHRTALNDNEEHFGGSNVFDIRTTDDDHNPEDDAEVIAFGQQKEKIDEGLLQQKEDVEDIIKEKAKAKKETEKEVDDEAISFGR